MLSLGAVFVLLATISHVHATGIVFFPPQQAKSPYKYFLRMAEEVHSRGYQTSILVADSMQKKDSTARHVYYLVNCTLNLEELISSEVKKIHHHSPLDSASKLLQVQRDCCKSVLQLQDSATLQELKDANLLVIFAVDLCAAFIAEYLKKPFIVVYPCCFPTLGSPAKVPTPSSYVPVSTFRETSDQMTFMERTMNVFTVLFGGMISEKILNYYMGEFTQKYKIEKTFADIFAQAEMHLVNNDFAVEFAHPLMPNVFYVGPLLAGPAEKLPPEFEKIMQDSGDNGVLLVSFGTEIGMLNDNINSAIAEALSKLDQTVIWKIKLPTHIKVSSNVKTFDWIPQNDLLGHEKLKAFVSHMGNNGAYEAAYHGVPLIAAPVWMDNLSNTKRFEHKAKMAKFIDVFKADSSEWQNTIEDVLYNPSYKTNALRVSKLIRSHPRTAVQRAGDLIEYTLVNGGRLPHLKAHAFNLTWYQYYSIDVVAFLAAVVIFGTFITVKFVMLVFRCAKGVFAKDKLKKT